MTMGAVIATIRKGDIVWSHTTREYVSVTAVGPNSSDSWLCKPRFGRERVIATEDLIKAMPLYEFSLAQRDFISLVDQRLPLRETTDDILGREEILEALSERDWPLRSFLAEAAYPDLSLLMEEFAEAYGQGRGGILHYSVFGLQH